MRGQCRDAGFEMIPDLLLLQHTGASSERHAICCFVHNGEYDWSKMKQAIELLYPTVIARPAQPQGRAGRGRGAHEVQNSDSWFSDWPMPMVDNQMAEWIEYYDPVEALAVNMVYEDEYAAIPEGLARELHGCLTTHRRIAKSWRRLCRRAVTS